MNDVEERPGVTSKVLQPEECEELLKKALEICPDIKVAGIAGPGDTLASDQALKTFEIIKEKFPDLIKCMSTNGLLLYEREVALEKDIQFILGAFPMNERLIFNRTYAGYRGSLTFTEDIYDNN